MSNIWIVEKLSGSEWKPVTGYKDRESARRNAKYFNGFSHGTKRALNRVRKYVRAE